MNVKDIAGVALASLLLFPVVLVVSLFATGSAHIQLGMDEPLKQGMTEFLKTSSAEQDSSDRAQSKVFQANLNKEKKLAMQQKKVEAEVERLQNLQIENRKLRDEIKANRIRIEKAVEGSKVLSNKRLAKLAEVYGSMKPAEAAPILLSLKDSDIAKIVALIPEVRSQAKLMAALGAGDLARAAKITGILGWKKEKTRRVLGNKG